MLGSGEGHDHWDRDGDVGNNAFSGNKGVSDFTDTVVPIEVGVSWAHWLRGSHCGRDGRGNGGGDGRGNGGGDCRGNGGGDGWSWRFDGGNGCGLSCGCLRGLSVLILGLSL